MLNTRLNLNKDVFLKDVKRKSPRDGFGEAIANLASRNKSIITLSADLSESVKLQEFKKNYPNRFIQTGIAEQNMCSIASGLAMEEKIPFVVSHAVFLTYRGWDQIRLSICMNNLNVKICGTHEGFSNGPDGASAEPLEDIALMRVLPNMTVINPIDYEQTKTAITEISKIEGPVYLRFSKAEIPSITTKDTPFKIGKADILTEGKDVTLISCGAITYEALVAAKNLKAKYKIDAELISSPTIKPLDEMRILESAKKTGFVVTIEEHQIIGGLGGAVSELLSEKLPTPLLRIGVEDAFGESGSYEDLKNKFGLSAHRIEDKVVKFLKEKK
ncbi:transketolase family protein [Patescibacteria group bacterium]|nr:transketolase family protein [Patescibacteria group bacterium]